MADSMQIEITDNSGLVKEELQAAVLRALEKCGLTAEGYAKRRDMQSYYVRGLRILLETFETA